jgi:hypothetical protein
MNIVGRKSEIEILEYCYNSNQSEFVAVYGRRRVGKTFMVRELFKDRLTFYASGILNQDTKTQLAQFNKEIAGFNYAGIEDADDWISAFENLNTVIEKMRQSGNNRKKVIFLDEIPWLAGKKKSGFLAGLDYFWNRWASSRNDVMLIICGSAATWIADNVINNTGGLHNRLTRHILLQPFTLKECELFYEERRIPFTRKQTAEAYMIFGGIPYYMNLFMPHLSLYQNVDAVYFSEGAELRNEFNNLYDSLFCNSETYIHVISALASKGIGMTRNEIVNASGLSDGGSLTKIINNLVTCGFVRKYKTYGNKEKDSLYQLIDFFSMFDIKFREKRDTYSSDYWLQISTTPSYHVWSGFSFEKLCLLHTPQIMKKLGIAGIRTSVYAWNGDMDGSKAQIDLVIERADKVINLCEVKFSSDIYAIDKNYAEVIRKKRFAFAYSTKTRFALHNTMITTYGVTRNVESAEIISNVVLDDLFV